MRREKFGSACKLGTAVGSKKFKRHKKKGRERGREGGKERGKLGSEILGEASESTVQWRAQQNPKTERKDFE